MAQLPEAQRTAIRAAALPRFFDRAFLNALLDKHLDEEQFISSLSSHILSITPVRGRYNVHEHSRKLLQEKLWQENAALYRKISRRAFVYCREQDQEDITWQIETIYHQLIAEPKKGAGALNNTCVHLT